LLLGLRVSDGVERGRVETLRGKPLNADALAWLIEQGLVVYASGRICLTQSGRVLSNRIVAELVS
jgi:oxygen-independent coproporphyrinogen-3 oxidase